MEIFLRNYGYDALVTWIRSLFGSHEIRYCTNRERGTMMSLDEKKKGASEVDEKEGERGGKRENRVEMRR